MSAPPGTMKSPFPLVLHLKAPMIKRRHLRRYSWLPDVFRLKGSIVSRIAGPVLTVTIFASLVAYAAQQGYKFIWTNSIVPLLSVVVGLILVFRNGTSYDRFWEGRKCFSAVTSLTRSFARQVWVNVSLPPTDMQPPGSKGKTLTTDVTLHQLRRKKIEALRLCLAFVFAAKHYLRGEDGINYADYHGVLPNSFLRCDEMFNSHQTSMASTYAATKDGSVDANGKDASSTRSGSSTPDAARPDATKRVRPKRSKPQLANQSTPLLAGAHRSIDIPYADEVSLPLPLVIAHELSRIIFQFRRDGFLETVGPAGTNALTQIIQGLVEQLTAMERVANTPIPISYGIHLKQCVTLYLFALPLTLVNDLGWASVPIVTVVAFTFMGIEGIAEEIEMPFGTDERDLPLDRYCQDLKEEIDYIIERLPEGGEGRHGYDDGEGDD